MSFLTRASLLNRSIVALAVIGIIAFGVYAATALKQELIPSLTLPAVTVNATYQGASPEIVDEEVTQVLESAIQGGEGQTGITSTSTEGNATIQVEYDYGTDTDDAVQELQESVNQVSAQLPEDAETTVQAGSTDSLPIITLAASSTGDEGELAQNLEDLVAPEISSIEGVSEASVTGVRNEIVTITLDEDELEERNLTVDQVSQAFQSSGSETPAGSIERDGNTLSVQVGDSFDSVDELRNLYITRSSGGSASLSSSATGATGTTGATATQTTTTQTQGTATEEGTAAEGTATEGTTTEEGTAAASQYGTAEGQAATGETTTGEAATTEEEQAAAEEEEQAAAEAEEEAAREAEAASRPVRLDRVADVETTLEESTSITRTNGEPSLGVSVTSTQDGNTVDISDAINENIPEWQETLGSGAELVVVSDDAPSITQSIEGLVTEGGLGLLFAVLVILVFLLSIRSTLVTAVSIPLSVLIALIVLWAWDYSLNTLTLSALTIAIGRVVDDSIVVLENIKRHLEYGEEKSRAIVGATREVAGAVTASTLTTIAVFLPIAFVGGIVGELFSSFSITVAVALAASLLVSLTVIPVLAYWFLKTPRSVTQTEDEIREAADARERRNPLQRAYVPVIRWAVGHRILTLLAAFLIFAGSMALIPRLETNFLGDSGQNTFSITQELPAGTSLEETEQAAQQVEEAIEGTEGVESYQVTIGGAGGGMGFGPPGMGGGGSSDANTASFSLVTDLEADQAAIEADLRERLDAVEDAGEVSFESADAGFSSSNLEVAIEATDEEALTEAEALIREAVEETPDTADVTSNLTDGEPELRVLVDSEAAAEEGLTETGIAQTVSQATQGSTVAEVNLDGEQRDVTLQLDSELTSADDLRELELTSTSGETVQLRDVADVLEFEAPTVVTRTEGERTATVTATATGANTGSISTDLQQRLNQLDLPEGASYSLGGVTADQNEAFASLGLALLVAIGLVYLVMVGTFRSLIQPVLLMVSIPFAATGSIVLLLLTGTALGVAALIGALMLVGIVVTNAIVLLDLVHQYRVQGMDSRTAVVEGGRRRLRPILMTAVATICALMPMALGLTASSGFISQPLAIVVIGGLATSTVLTLVLVPVLYTIVEDLNERSKKRRERRRARREEKELEKLERQARKNGHSPNGLSGNGHGDQAQPETSADGAANGASEDGSSDVRVIRRQQEEDKPSS